jgi:hypothetical protein
MPAVIQRSFTPEGAMFATTQWAAREDDLFNGDSWKWIDCAEGAAVFEDILQAEKQMELLREPGVWIWAATRPAAESRLPIADSKVAAPASEPVRAAAVRGVSPSQMAAGSQQERIRAARQNRRVTAQRRSAEDFRRVYEATCARLGEHDDE